MVIPYSSPHGVEVVGNDFIVPVRGGEGGGTQMVGGGEI